jgi:hypothetical protein
LKIICLIKPDFQVLNILNFSVKYQGLGLLSPFLLLCFLNRKKNKTAKQNIPVLIKPMVPAVKPPSAFLHEEIKRIINK